MLALLQADGEHVGAIRSFVCVECCQSSYRSEYVRTGASTQRVLYED